MQAAAVNAETAETPAPCAHEQPNGREAGARLCTAPSPRAGEPRAACVGLEERRHLSPRRQGQDTKSGP